MTSTCLLAAGLALLLSVECSVLHREKRDVDFISGTCDTDQTKVYTRTILTTEYTKCPINTLVSRYFTPFLDECEHWMGSRPDHVASSYVYYCLEDPTTGGVKIKASLCCKGVAPANRCVTCVSTDPDVCDYSAGAVVTCADDEFCETQLACGTSSLQATIRKSCVKKCSSSSSCNMKTYLQTGEVCADCCNTAFCNKGGQALACYSKCECNMVAGHYHCDASGNCLCNAGCTGDRCETCTATCNPNPCKNSGTCQISGSTVSCCCKPGYGGQYCENKLPSCDRSYCSNHGECYDKVTTKQCVCDPGYSGETCEKIEDPFMCPSSKNVYFSNPTPYQTTCSSLIKTSLSRTAELGGCKYYMKSQYNTAEVFKEGTNGHVTEVTDVGYNYCNVGDCGYVHYQTKTCCPSCFSNPCQNGGYCIQIEQNGVEEDYVCRCKFGFTGKYCEKRVQTCFVFGEPHYITFDGKFFTFQGNCRYILTSHQSSSSGLTPFTVYVKNEYRTDDHTVSYPSYVEVSVYGYSIRLGRNNVVEVKTGSQDFKQVSLNAYYSDFSIKTAGRFVRFETSFGLVVQYDGYNMMFVQMPDSYGNQLGGLCNNMNGDPNDDLRDCSGVMRSDDESGYSKYGDSCLDPDYSDPSGNCKTDPPPSCDVENYAGNEWCGYIVDKNGPFSSCINDNSENDFIACKYDVCRDQSAKCQALESFVEKCYKSGGAPDSNWRSVTGCPMNCSTNAHYEFQGSACQPTCENPKAHLSCEFEDTEVCQCNDNMLLKDGKCVPITECGCKDSDNVRHEFGDKWDVDLETCLTKTCVMCSASSCSTPGNITIVSASPVNGQWGSWGTWSVCTQGVTTQSRTRQCDNPSPKCGGADCVGSDKETKECPTTTTTSTTDTTTTTTTTTTMSTVPTVPSCASNFDYAEECGKCDKTRNPNMYIANPCGCESYFQCYRDQFGSYHVRERPCSDCTCWNQTILTCDHDRLHRNKNWQNCKNDVPIGGGSCVVKYGGTVFIRRLRPVPGDNTHYIDVDAGSIKMPCAPGTVFDSSLCTCVFGPNNLQQKEFFCLDFNDKNNPYKTTTGVWVSPSNSGLYPGVPGIKGYGLRFDGGNLEVPALNNKEIRRMTITLWFKRDKPQYGGLQGLLANEDCNNDQHPTIRLLSQSPTRVAGGIRTTIYDIISGLTVYVADDSNWHHVVMTYDMDKMMAILYLDGNKVASKYVNGVIPGAHCPLIIGSLYASNFFHGVMDQVCFYDYAFTASQVKTAYVNHE